MKSWRTYERKEIVEIISQWWEVTLESYPNVRWLEALTIVNSLRKMEMLDISKEEFVKVCDKYPKTIMRSSHTGLYSMKWVLERKSNYEDSIPTYVRL